MPSTGKQNKSSELTPNGGEGYILISPFRSTREVSQCRSRVVPTARLSYQPWHTPARFCREAWSPSPGCRGLKTSLGWTLAIPGQGCASAHGLTKTSYWAETGRHRHQTGPAGFSSLIRTDAAQRDSTALAATLSSLPKASHLSLFLQKPAVFNVRLPVWFSVTHLTHHLQINTLLPALAPQKSFYALQDDKNAGLHPSKHS